MNIPYTHLWSLEQVHIAESSCNFDKPSSYELLLAPVICITHQSFALSSQKSDVGSAILMNFINNGMEAACVRETLFIDFDAPTAIAWSANGNLIAVAFPHRDQTTARVILLEPDVLHVLSRRYRRHPPLTTRSSAGTHGARSPPSIPFRLRRLPELLSSTRISDAHNGDQTGEDTVVDTTSEFPYLPACRAQHLGC